MNEIGSEFSLSEDKNYYFGRLTKFGNKVQFLRSGRDAIGYIVDSIRNSNKIVLIPSYSCDSVVKPFIIRGWKIVYYPIKSDFSVDLNYLQSLIFNLRPDVILVMNYFGLSNTTSVVSTIRNCQPLIRIIEDITHVLFDIEKLHSQKVDYYIGSIRKWLGILDGAVVISNNNEIPEINYVESEFVNLRRIALNSMEEYLHTGSMNHKIKYRALLIDAERSLENGKIPYCISPDSNFLLQNLNAAPLMNSRKWNTNLLLKKLKSLTQIRFPGNINEILNYTPFCIPIFISNRDKVQKLLAENGIYCPVLWPLNEEARKISPESIDIENNILCIPIDQRYNYADMDQIFKMLKNVMSN